MISFNTRIGDRFYLQLYVGLCAEMCASRVKGKDYFELELVNTLLRTLARQLTTQLKMSL